MSFFFLHSAFFFLPASFSSHGCWETPKAPSSLHKDAFRRDFTGAPQTPQNIWSIPSPIQLTYSDPAAYNTHVFNLYICLLVKLSERWKWSRRSKGLKGCLNHEDDKPGPRKLFLLIHSQAIHYTVNLLWNTLYKHIWFFNDQDVFSIYAISPNENHLQRSQVWMTSPEAISTSQRHYSNPHLLWRHTV